MPGNYSINAEDIRLAANPALEVDSGGLRVKVAGTDLERIAGGLRIAVGAVDGNAGLQGGGGTAISLKLSNRMEFSAGALRAKVKPNEGLGDDAAGYFVNKTQAYSWTGQHDYGTLPPTVNADPGSANHLTRRSWVLSQIDLAKNNFDVKDSVRLATAEVLPAYTQSLNGGVTRLTANANGALSVDGLAAANGDRVLVLKETAGNAPWNGVYLVTDAGSGGTPFILDRASDADSPTEFTPGLFVGVEEGQTLAKSRWVMTTPAPFTLDVSNVNFARYDAGTMQAGAGLARNGDVIDVLLEAASPSLQVVGDELGIKFDENGGLQKGANGTSVKLEADKGLGTTGAGLKVVEDPNGGVLVDASGVGIRVDTTGSGRVQKTSNGVRVVSGGLGLPVSFRTEEYAASTFTYNAGPNLSTHNVNATPSVHANIIEAQALLKNGADTMIRVSGAPANADEWRLNGTTLEIFGDVTLVGGDKYRVRYATDV